MNAALWIVQVLLALVFLMAGGMKLLQPKQALVDRMGVFAPIQPLAIKGIGLAEILGAIGLLLPPLVGVAVGLVPWAAFGLACVMVGAMIAHGQRGEWPQIGATAALFLLAVFVMYGRSKYGF